MHFPLTVLNVTKTASCLNVFWGITEKVTSLLILKKITMQTFLQSTIVYFG